MSTPLSSTVPYATVADLKKHRHWKQIADWVTWDATTGRVDEEDLDDADTDAGATVLEHLMAASGLVESACLRGERYDVFNLIDSEEYTTDELAAFVEILIAIGLLPEGSVKLTTEQKAKTLVGASRALLKRIVCGLALGTLSRFKSRTATQLPEEGAAYEMLDALADGKRIFSITEAGTAGLPGYVEMAGAGSDEEEDRISVQASRMFGSRTK